ncbi:hypothetical protein RDABS01_022226 [Bienertia sinuspersici]
MVRDYEKVVDAQNVRINKRALTTSWSPPPAGVYKINTDTAFEGESVGMGAIMRDNVGDVMVSLGYGMRGSATVEVDEALATRLGVKIALEASLSKLILETHNLRVYYALMKGKCENNSFGSIIRDILVLANQCHFVSFTHVKKSGNKAAHIMAKLSFSLGKMRVWIEEAPNNVMQVIHSDI